VAGAGLIPRSCSGRLLTGPFGTKGRCSLNSLFLPWSVDARSTTCKELFSWGSVGGRTLVPEGTGADSGFPARSYTASGHLGATVGFRRRPPSRSAGFEIMPCYPTPRVDHFGEASEANRRRPPPIRTHQRPLLVRPPSAGFGQAGNAGGSGRV
jgi:hypothetical protein